MMPRTSEGDAALVEDDPGDVEGDGDADEQHAEGDEEGDGSAASGDVHGVGGSIAGVHPLPAVLRKVFETRCLGVDFSLDLRAEGDLAGVSRWADFVK